MLLPLGFDLFERGNALRLPRCALRDAAALRGDVLSYHISGGKETAPRLKIVLSLSFPDGFPFAPAADILNPAPALSGGRKKA